jgi:hypothetical protein
VFRTHRAVKVEEPLFWDCDTFLNDPVDPLSIGFSYVDSGCTINKFAQVLVDFDLDWLSQIPGKQITGALLTVTEAPTHDRVAATCMGGVSMLPAGWENLPAGTRIFGGPMTGLRLPDGPDGARTWNVLEDVKRSTSPGQSLTGFVFHAIEENLDVERSDTCLSKLSNPQLRLEYTVSP